MSLRLLLLLHGLVTAAAGVLLIAAPEVIPGTVGIPLGREQYLLCWFLAAAELALAFLSLAARNFSDPRALRTVCRCFALFHLFTAVLEALSIEQQVSVALLVNAGVRVVVAAAFLYYAAKEGM